MNIKEKDFRKESIILRQDWMRKRENMEALIRQLGVMLTQAPTSDEMHQIKSKAALIEKTFRKHLEEQERSLRSLEKNGCLLDREQKVTGAYKKIFIALQWVQQANIGIVGTEDLVKCDGQDLFGPGVPDEPLLIDKDTCSFHNALFLESVLTDWQKAAARIIERKLLVPKRIGSLCFYSGQNSLLGMKLSFMLRTGLIELNKDRAKICAQLKNAWSTWRAHFRLLINTTFLRPSQLAENFKNVFDALFLDYEILKLWAQDVGPDYLESVSDLEPAFPFLILLLTENQVEPHREALRHMDLEIHSLDSNYQDVLGEDVSTLLIARRKSRYILHYASDPWDMFVKDFVWHHAPSLKQPHSERVANDFPSPFHLSEKILLTDEFAARVANIVVDTGIAPAVWSARREAVCWRKYGEQVPEIPRLVSEETTDKEWKIVLFLGKGNWTFARNLQMSDILAQTDTLLKLISWFRDRSLFLNNIRTDNIAVDGPAIRLLSLERLGPQETEDTLNSLLWFWYDLTNPVSFLRPWPIEYFPEENLSKIPELLQEIARAASSAPDLDTFLNNLPTH